MTELSLILPVHNEEDIIEPVYREIRLELEKLNISFECMLVENGSSDGTLATLEKLKKTYPHTHIIVAPKGYGSAVIAGLKKAQGKYVSYMPSDGQIDLSVFPMLWKETQKNIADVVKIRRITRESWDRSLVSYIFSYFVSFVFGIPKTDVNGSPRILLNQNVQKLNLQSMDSFIDTEFAVKAHLLGWKIKEISMKTLVRCGGVSTRSLNTYIEFLRNIIVYRMHTYPLVRQLYSSIKPI